MTIVGIDEVGRGAWAGPLTVAALAGPTGDAPAWWHELDDSKRVSAKKRERLSLEVFASDLPVAVVHVAPITVDEVGLTQALRMGATRALEMLHEDWDLDEPVEVVVDGLDGLGIGRALPHADQLVREVSGASIVAKVARDAAMVAFAETYPGYGFERHVGYGVAEHREALELLGPCLLHRFTVRPVALRARACVHHWVLVADSAVPMTAEEQRQLPYRLKRQGRCKKCGLERTHLERIQLAGRYQ